MRLFLCALLIAVAWGQSNSVIFKTTAQGHHLEPINSIPCSGSAAGRFKIVNGHPSEDASYANGVYTVEPRGSSEYTLSYDIRASSPIEYGKGNNGCQPLTAQREQLPQVIFGFTGFNQYVEFGVNTPFDACGIAYNGNTFTRSQGANANCWIGLIQTNSNGDYHNNYMAVSTDSRIFNMNPPRGGNMRGVVVQWLLI